jgi:hypothetical protein
MVIGFRWCKRKFFNHRFPHDNSIVLNQAICNPWEGEAPAEPCSAIVIPPALAKQELRPPRKFFQGNETIAERC